MRRSIFDSGTRTFYASVFTLAASSFLTPISTAEVVSIFLAVPTASSVGAPVSLTVSVVEIPSSIAVLVDSWSVVWLVPVSTSWKNYVFDRLYNGCATVFLGMSVRSPGSHLCRGGTVLLIASWKYLFLRFGWLRLLSDPFPAAGVGLGLREVSCWVREGTTSQPAAWWPPICLDAPS